MSIAIDKRWPQDRNPVGKGKLHSITCLHNLLLNLGMKHTIPTALYWREVFARDGSGGAKRGGVYGGVVASSTGVKR